MWFFLMDWRRRGILVSEGSMQKLQDLMGALRRRLIPADQLREMLKDHTRLVALQQAQRGPTERQAYTPAANGDTILTIDAAPAINTLPNENATKPAASPPEQSATPVARPDDKSAWEEARAARLRRLGEMILQQYPPEQWLIEAKNRLRAFPASKET
jgi:hypothetical protein